MRCACDSFAGADILARQARETIGKHELLVCMPCMLSADEREGVCASLRLDKLILRTSLVRASLVMTGSAYSSNGIQLARSLVKAGAGSSPDRPLLASFPYSKGRAADATARQRPELMELLVHHHCPM